MFSSFYNEPPHVDRTVQRTAAMACAMATTIGSGIKLEFSGLGPRPFSLRSFNNYHWRWFSDGYFNRREALVAAKRLKEASHV